MSALRRAHCAVCYEEGGLDPSIILVTPLSHACTCEGEIVHDLVHPECLARWCFLLHPRSCIACCSVYRAQVAYHALMPLRRLIMVRIRERALARLERAQRELNEGGGG